MKMTQKGAGLDAACLIRDGAAAAVRNSSLPLSLLLVLLRLPLVVCIHHPPSSLFILLTAYMRTVRYATVAQLNIEKETTNIKRLSCTVFSCSSFFFLVLLRVF